MKVFEMSSYVLMLGLTKYIWAKSLWNNLSGGLLHKSNYVLKLKYIFYTLNFLFS